MIRLLLAKYKSEVLTTTVMIASLAMIVAGLLHVVIEVHSIDRRIVSSLRENRELGKKMEVLISTNRVLLTENQRLLGNILDRLERKP